MTRLARYRKAIVAALGGAAIVAAAIPPDTPFWRWAQVILALATALGVRQVPNASQQGPSRAARRAQLAEEISQPPSRTSVERPEPERRPRRPPPDPGRSR